MSPERSDHGCPRSTTDGNGGQSEKTKFLNRSENKIAANWFCHLSISITIG